MEFEMHVHQLLISPNSCVAPVTPPLWTSETSCSLERRWRIVISMICGILLGRPAWLGVTPSPMPIRSQRPSAVEDCGYYGRNRARARSNDRWMEAGLGTSTVPWLAKSAADLRRGGAGSAGSTRTVLQDFMVSHKRVQSLRDVQIGLLDNLPEGSSRILVTVRIMTCISSIRRRCFPFLRHGNIGLEGRR